MVPDDVDRVTDAYGAKPHKDRIELVIVTNGSDATVHVDIMS